jgi:hypothetical protein
MPQCLAGAFLVVSILLLSASVSAQTGADFHQMQARVGDFLFVNDPDRRVEISGQVTSVSDHELTIDGYRFVPKPGLKVERAGDTIWDGAALGFLAGGVAGVTVGAEGCLNRSKAPCFFGNGLVFGALGAYWDWRHTGRTVVFLGAQPPSARAAATDPIALSSLDTPTAFDFSALELRPGDRVAITAPDGTQTTGPITALSRNTFRVGAVDLSRTSPILVERIGDPIWDGTAYGAGFAVMMGVAGQTGVRDTTTRALIYGSIGAIIDACIKGRTIVYEGADPPGRASLRFVPELGPHRKGGAVVVRF